MILFLLFSIFSCLRARVADAPRLVSRTPTTYTSS